MARTRILIVDDEPDLCTLVKGYLERDERYEVMVAHSGREGLAQARKMNPDLILLDVMMPGMSGVELLAKLKAEYPMCTIPVVMVTALSDPETALEASRLYDEGYLTKPFEMGRLRATIEKVLGRVNGAPAATSNLPV